MRKGTVERLFHLCPYKYIVLVFLAMMAQTSLYAQINYGTTGLMNMSTADMQRDKTFMFGGNWLNHHATVPRWWYDTWNYYINMTFFSWLEVGYLCTGHKAVPIDYGNSSGYWVPSTYGKFVNQDRSFHIRFRIWKEGWWKSWTPQIVIGGNDAIGGSWDGGSLSKPSESIYSNGFLNRYYLALTKHIAWQNWGTLGMHLSWIYGKRFDNDLNDFAVGADFHFNVPDNDFFAAKLLNSIQLMAEMIPGYTDVTDNLYFDPAGPKYQVNVGMTYSVWRERINLTAELNRCKYLSGGICFRIHLK